MSRRGGRRRKWIQPSDAAVSCDGRWGRRRVRVEQCAATLAAEVVYGRLVCEGATFGPGSRLTVYWLPAAFGGTTWPIAAEVTDNAVWRRGRLFLRCSRCQRRATRLYVPIVGQDPRCRKCWGLNYVSQSWSYKPCGAFGALFGPVACVTTDTRREERRREARDRYAARRAVL